MFRFFQPFCPTLPAKIGKVLILPKKCNMGIKKRRICCWSRIRWKNVKKNHVKKVINEKLAEKWSFYFFTVCRSFRPIMMILLHFFFNGFYDTQIEFLQKKCLLTLKLFVNFNAKIGRKGSKKQKNVFYKWALESHFASISIL